MDNLFEPVMDKPTVMKCITEAHNRYVVSPEKKYWLGIRNHLIELHKHRFTDSELKDILMKIGL